MDQVTVNRTSFTVICTYFFFDGKIYVILNKLQKLTTEDYNSEGTASMVIKTLCETLGFTKSKLSYVLKHLVYDGGRQSGIMKVDITSGLHYLVKIGPIFVSLPYVRYFLLSFQKNLPFVKFAQILMKKKFCNVIIP